MSSSVSEEISIVEISNEGRGAPLKKRKQYRQKIKHTWADTDVVKLISEVETRPCIWNAGDEEHKNRIKRESAWREIANTFDNTIEVDQLTGQWESLRASYRNILSNAKKTKSGQSFSTQLHWKFYKNMAFVGSTESEQRVQSESNLIFVEELDATQTGTENDSSPPTGSGIAKCKRKDDSETDNKEKKELLVSGMKAVINRLQQPKETLDDVQVFTNYLALNLRKIKDDTCREYTQRRLLQVLWESIDNEPKCAEYTIILNSSDDN